MNQSRIILSLLIILLLCSCQSNKRYVPDFSNNIDYAHKVTTYSYSNGIKEIFSYDFYDKKNNLIESVGFECRKKIIYDSIGKLQEKLICRMYNCEVGFREILIKDRLGNIIGLYNTREETLDIDTIHFKQTKFYNERSQLIKELIHSGNNFYGEYFEYWKYYAYENNHIISDIEICNNDTVWNGQYSYNDVGNLVSIIYTNKKGTIKTKKFEYNQLGKLIKETVEKDKHLLKRNVSFDVDNNTKTYMYDDRERLVEKIKFNHKGKIQNRFIYEYEDKLPPTSKM